MIQVAIIIVLIIIVIGMGVYFTTKKNGDKTRMPLYVRVEKDDGNLYLRELEVFVNGKNIAPESKATISKARWQWTVDQINDEVIPRSYRHKDKNYAHTKTGSPRFMQLELPSPVPIEKIIVYNRYDDNRKAIIGARIMLLDSTRTTLWSHTFEEEFLEKSFTFDQW